MSDHSRATCVKASRNLDKALDKSLDKSLGKSGRCRLPFGPGKAIVAAYPRRLKRLIRHTDIAFYGIVPAGRFARCP
jgi:hypothetical protein